MADAAKAAQGKSRLGRGLSSLIGSIGSVATAGQGEYPSAGQAGHVGQPPAALHHQAAAAGVLEIPITDIAPNPHQPRQQFGSEELQELADSIVQQGVIQPLVVAHGVDHGASKAYVLVAGERRLRAAKLAGLSSVPCVVRKAGAAQMTEVALVENIQRTDLNPVERAGAYKQYMEQFKLTQAEAAQRLGEPRATIANYLRILELDEEIRKLILADKLSFGHAKILAGLSDDSVKQLTLARKVASEGLSVRALEELSGQADQSPERQKKIKPRSAHIADLEEQLSQLLGTKVRIQAKNRQAGRIVIEYYTLDDFDRIAQQIGLKMDA
ncbi:MAG: ParB/RepB/Spo0J family partition protein [Planctomycetes bacterium]|nr:ParB/RepB/Spo0J family partition protein [Planctomycetota bacterium]